MLGVNCYHAKSWYFPFPCQAAVANAYGCIGFRRRLCLLTLAAALSAWSIVLLAR